MAYRYAKVVARCKCGVVEYATPSGRTDLGIVNGECKACRWDREHPKGK